MKPVGPIPNLETVAITVPNGYRRQENLSRAPPSAQAGYHQNPVSN